MISQRMLLGIGVLLFLAACQPATPSPTPSSTPIPTTTPTPTPVPVPEWLYPPDVRTGIPEVDAIIEIVAAQDIEALRNLVGLTEVPCTTTRQYGTPLDGPLCRGGEKEGTPIPVFSELGCEHRYLRHIKRALKHFEDYPYYFPMFVYTVYPSPRAMNGVHPFAYEIILASYLEDNAAQNLFLDTEGRIVGVYGGCAWPSLMVAEGADDFLLPPLAWLEQDRTEALYGFLWSNADSMLYWLRIASGEDVPCGDPCERYEDFGGIVDHQVEYCQKIEPAAERQNPAYDPQRVDEILVPLADACAIIQAARYHLGAPQEGNEDWMAAVLEAKDVLINALQQTAPPPQPFHIIFAPGPTAVPQPSPTPEIVPVPEGLYPADVRTSIPEVDVVLEALAAHDLEALNGLMQLTDIPCGNQYWPEANAPTCPEGVEEGTPIPVFPNWNCFPNYSDLGVAQSGFKYIYTVKPPSYVYAIYRSPRLLEGGSPIAYEIVIASSLHDDLAQIVFLDPEGQIIRIDLCTFPQRMLPEGIVDFILLPLSEAG